MGAWLNLWNQISRRSTLPRGGPARSFGVALPLVLALCVTMVGPAQAQSSVGAEETLLQAPEEQTSHLSLLGNFDLVLPVVSGALCPEGAGCVFGTGVGVTIGVERRFASGWALGLFYAAWFLDSDGVFEVGVSHQLRARVRYWFLRKRVIHPYVFFDVGGTLLGDSLNIATAGALVSTGGGLELELTDSLAIWAAVPIHALWAAEFTSPRDGVTRSEGFVPSLAVSVQVGMVLSESP